MPGASESLSHWLANIGMHNFNWVWDDSPSPSSSARPSVTPTPSSGHLHPHPSWSPNPSPSWSYIPTSSSTPTPSPTLYYYDPYATYYVYPTHSSSTWHSWDIHHPSSTHNAVHNILQTPTPFSSTHRPTATPMLSWGPPPTTVSSVRVSPTTTPTPTSTPTPSHASTTPEPSKAKAESNKDEGDDEQDEAWGAFYDSLSGRIRDALDSSDELWL